MITEQGRKALKRYIAGEQNNIADTIVIGLGNAGGEAMQCEWLRLPVKFVATDPDSSKVIFKASGITSIAGSIYEVGLMQGVAGISGDVILSNFTMSEGWNGDFEEGRLDKGLIVQSNTTKNIQINNLDLSKIRNNDILSLATKAGGSGVVTVKLTFSTTGSASFAFNVTNGYNVVNLARSLGTTTGSPNNVLTNLEVSASVGITLDLLKFISVNNNEVLLARKVLTQPTKVQPDQPLDIEYPIGVSIVNA